MIGAVAGKKRRSNLLRLFFNDLGKEMRLISRAGSPGITNTSIHGMLVQLNGSLLREVS
jgi:hypothetical protein